MSKKSIKRKRMLRYFIEAAKKIIEEEGVDHVTARKVGDISGYSYATIYNYFKDIKELLAYCAYDYLIECSEEIKSINTDNLSLVEVVQEYNKTYFKYFATRPQLFQLVFLEDLENHPNAIVEESGGLEAGQILLKNLNKYAKKGQVRESDVSTIHGLCIYSVHGKLLFHVNNRDETSMEEMLALIDKEVMFILGEN